MANLLSRVAQKIFGDSGSTSQFGKIGSQSAGSPIKTKDLSTIQSLPQFLNGLYSITANAAQPPYIDDLNSLYLLITSQLAYIFQAGIPEYDPETNYFNGISWTQSGGIIYQSIYGTELDPNIGNTPASSPNRWRPLISADVAMTANSDLIVPSQKAVKSRLDTIQGNINAEASTRASADSSEASTRAAADTTLQNNINTETDSRITADSFLSGRIDTEASTRAAADTTLQNNINSEASTRAAEDTTLQSNINVVASRFPAPIPGLGHWAPIENPGNTINIPGTDGELWAYFVVCLGAVVGTAGRPVILCPSGVLSGGALVGPFTDVEAIRGFAWRID